MRALLTLVVLLCIGTIVFGNYHWNSKLGTAVDGKVVAVHKNSTETATEIVDKELTSQGDFRNLPIDLAEILQRKVHNGEVVNLAIIGSEVNSLHNNSWTSIFIQEMELTYNSLFNITVNSARSEVTTDDVIKGGHHLEGLNAKLDIVILEPYLLDSNGLIPINQSLLNISVIIEELKAENPDVFVFLQPGQPLHKAVYYPKDVEALKSWSEENGYTYINHWASWPDYQSDDLLQYMNPESIIPNEQGHKVWAEYIIKFFTGTE
ncbi:SGNH/GDSL hydrolase family protein [Sutcliffiella horikoshii]|uniref:SGNH/GDSL hydrolase family protein n=1 Tax=Sutcliffiella horikoshii TaxID=79883 RepID=UPI003CF37945